MEFQLFIFYKPACSQKKSSWTSTIHRGILFGWALWADSVSPQMNTIALRDQFKPIRIGENLVVNVNE